MCRHSVIGCLLVFGSKEDFDGATKPCSHCSQILNDVAVSFSGKANGTGVLYDVSTGGCKIQSDRTPPLGASLTLRLAIPPRAEPVKIDAAIVGWTMKGQYFGVKFLDVKPPERPGIRSIHCQSWGPWTGAIVILKSQHFGGGVDQRLSNAHRDTLAGLGAAGLIY